MPVASGERDSRASSREVERVREEREAAITRLRVSPLLGRVAGTFGWAVVTVLAVVLAGVASFGAAVGYFSGCPEDGCSGLASVFGVVVAVGFFIAVLVLVLWLASRFARLAKRNT